MRLLGILSILFVVAACESANKNKQDLANGNWATTMQSMARNVKDLTPFLFSSAEFSDPKNRSDLNEKLEDFEASVEAVPVHVGEQMLGKDPLISYSLGRLKENVRHARKAFQDGHVEYARTLLKASTNTCFNCHTANNLGPQNMLSKNEISSTFRMFPTERADYYVATRQYDKATKTLEKVLVSGGSFYDSPHEQSLALKKFLSLEVRVKKDPKEASSVLRSFLDKKSLPHYLERDAQNWLTSLTEWGRESRVQNPKTLARRLIQKANRKEKKSGYQSALVEHLRATSLLHEALLTAKNDREKSKIYMSLGSSYDVLSDIGVWDLPEVYFEACIRSWPKSKTAKRCYREFEKNLVLGFSGSAGILVPKEERARLAELKSLAGVQ